MATKTRDEKYEGYTTSGNLPTKENSLEEEGSMNGGTCGVYLGIQCVHAVQLARLPSVPSYRLSRVNSRGYTLSTARYLYERASLSLQLCDSSPFLFPLLTSVSRTPRESTDLFKRQSQRWRIVPRQESPLDSRIYLDFRFNVLTPFFFFFFFCIYSRCATIFIFVVIFSGPLKLARLTQIKIDDF